MNDKKIDFQSHDALLIIDVQVDFFPGGALPVKKSDTILTELNTWVKKAQIAGIPVYLSRDWHPLEHVSFREQGGAWPPHCIQDTAGAGFHPQFERPGNAFFITKGVRFDQDQNSAFDNTGVEAHMKKKGIKRLFVGGLALDVCVLATVMDALKHGFQVCLMTEATCPVNLEEGQKALTRMAESGVVLIEKTMPDMDICTMAPEWAEHARPNEPGPEPCNDGRGTLL